jgi:hypothetical protein
VLLRTVLWFVHDKLPGTENYIRDAILKTKFIHIISIQGVHMSKGGWNVKLIVR